MAAKQLLLSSVRNIANVGHRGVFARAMTTTSVEQSQTLANHRLTEAERHALEARFEHDYVGDEDMHMYRWKKIAYFAVVPFLALFFVWKVIIEHEPHSRVKFKPYEHIHIYRKPLPWRDGTGPLLFNKKMVPTKDGYITPPPSH